MVSHVEGIGRLIARSIRKRANSRRCQTWRTIHNAFQNPCKASPADLTKQFQLGNALTVRHMETSDVELPELQGLHSEKSTRRMNLIDRVRAHGVGDIVSLPQLVVCGDTSAGKSSVLEGITGVPFPRSEGVCTRFPTEIIFRHSSTANEITASIQPHSSRSQEMQNVMRQYYRTLAHMSELPTVIKEVSAIMQLRGHAEVSTGDAFSADTLRIEVTGTTNLNLTIVDLPGLISVASEEQTEDDIKLVRDMVEGHVQSSRTIILAVVQAGNEIVNQSVVQLARKHDPEGDRTIGIITKPDLIKKGGEASLVALANNESNVKLKLGFFLLKNPEPSMAGSWLTPQERLREELTFFSEPQWRQHGLDLSRAGVEKLRTFLQELLNAHTEREFPKVAEEIRHFLQKAEIDLSQLGLERHEVSQIRIFLSQIGTEFSQLAHAALEGRYHGSNYDLFNEIKDFRLRAVVHRKNGEFAEKVRTQGRKRVMKGEADSMDVAENTLEVSKSDMMAWVKQIYLSTRGCELPGGSNYILLAELFFEQSSPWKHIAKAHISDVVGIVSKWLQHAINRLITEGNVCKNVQDICSLWVVEATACAFEELGKIEEDERREPSTYNHYYTDNVQKNRKNTLEAAIETAITEVVRLECSQPNKNIELKPKTEKLREFVRTVRSKIQVNMDDHAAEEALGSLEAYYKVAMKTFVDNVCRQVIERHLLAPLPSVFSVNTVSRFTDEDLLRIGVESKRRKQRRSELTTRAQILRKSLAELQMS